MKAPWGLLDVVAPKDLSIAHLWTLFAGMVMDPGAPQLQREEMRMAYFAGFIECFGIITDASTRLTEAEAIALLDRLKKEGDEFARAFIAKRGGA